MSEDEVGQSFCKSQNAVRIQTWWRMQSQCRRYNELLRESGSSGGPGLMEMSSSVLEIILIFSGYPDALRFSTVCSCAYRAACLPPVWRAFWQTYLLIGEDEERISEINKFEDPRSSFKEAAQSFNCEVCDNSFKYFCEELPGLSESKGVWLQCPCVVKRQPFGGKPPLVVGAFGTARSSYNNGESSFIDSGYFGWARAALDQSFDVKYVALRTLECGALSEVDLLIIDTWSAGALTLDEQAALRTFLSPKIGGTVLVNAFGMWSVDGDNSKSLGTVFNVTPQATLAYSPSEFTAPPGWESTKKVHFHENSDKALLKGPFGEVTYFSNRVQTACRPKCEASSRQFIPLCYMPIPRIGRGRSASMNDFLRARRQQIDRQVATPNGPSTPEQMSNLQSRDFLLSFMPRTNTLWYSDDEENPEDQDQETDMGDTVGGQALLCSNWHWLVESNAWNGGLFPPPSAWTNDNETDPRKYNMSLFLNLASLSISKKSFFC